MTYVLIVLAVWLAVATVAAVLLCRWSRKSKQPTWRCPDYFVASDWQRVPS